MEAEIIILLVLFTLSFFVFIVVLALKVVFSYLATSSLKRRLMQYELDQINSKHNKP